MALASAAVITGTASADPATWSVSPGGAFTGEAGETILTTESGVELFCTSSDASGTAESGTGLSNPLASLPEGGVTFNDCQGPFGLTFEVAHLGTWELNGVSYDGSDVTTGTLDNITAQISGPACEATVTGSVNATYTNSTGTLSVLPEQTLTISTVDPSNDCLGLITQGEAAGFSGGYAISPQLTVTSP
ncbi:hypothetical protein [Actinophytocola oryzae]|uniref:hypothetical protein n=1 Tax=Actinophytocola oryzae TaxID=502181 RepID=UPI001062F7CA|nr:hypothetical protein [Actinophytocola oryzae]